MVKLPPPSSSTICLPREALVGLSRSWNNPTPLEPETFRSEFERSVEITTYGEIATAIIFDNMLAQGSLGGAFAQLEQPDPAGARNISIGIREKRRNNHLW